MAFELDLTNPDNLAANQRGRLTTEQREALARLPDSPYAFGVAMLAAITLPAAVGLVMGVLLQAGPWVIGGLALVTLLTALSFSAYQSVRLVRFYWLRHDLQAEAIATAEGRVVWRGSYYAAVLADQPSWKAERVSGLPPGAWRFYYLPRSGRVLSAQPLMGLRPRELDAELTRILGRTIGFTERDLQHNRAGRLGPGQVGRIVMVAVGRLLLAGVFGVILWEAVNLLPALFEGAPDGLRDHYLGYLCFGALIILALVQFTWAAVQDALYNQIVVVEGPLTRSRTQGSRAWPYHYFRIGDTRLAVTRASYAAVIPGENYRLYYLRRSDRLIAAELVRPAEPPSLAS